MAIALRDSTTSLTGTVNKPTGTVDGDLVLLFGYNNSTTLPSIAGWTTIFTRALTSSAIGVFAKIASSEGASWTVTNSQATIAVSYSGAAIPTQQVNAAAGATGSLTVVGTTSWLVDVFFSATASGSVPAHSVPSGYTLRRSNTESFGGGNIRQSLWDSNGTVSAGSKSVTNATTSTINGSGLIVIPEGGAVVNTSDFFQMF